jgi:hypothetical protein
MILLICTASWLCGINAIMVAVCCGELEDFENAEVERGENKSWTAELTH